MVEDKQQYFSSMIRILEKVIDFNHVNKYAFFISRVMFILGGGKNQLKNLFL